MRIKKAGGKRPREWPDRTHHTTQKGLNSLPLVPSRKTVKDVGGVETINVPISLAFHVIHWSSQPSIQYLNCELLGVALILPGTWAQGSNLPQRFVPFSIRGSGAVSRQEQWINPPFPSCRNRTTLRSSEEPSRSTREATDRMLGSKCPGEPKLEVRSGRIEEVIVALESRDR